MATRTVGAAAVACIAIMVAFSISSIATSGLGLCAAAIAVGSCGLVLVMCLDFATEEPWSPAPHGSSADADPVLDELVVRIERLAGPERTYAVGAAVAGRERIQRIRQELEYLSEASSRDSERGPEPALDELRQELDHESTAAWERLHRLYATLVRIEVSGAGDPTLEAALRRLAAEMEVARA